ATVRARRTDMLHLPGAGLITISSRGERTDRADIDAHAALFTLEVIFFVGDDGRDGAAVIYTERPNIHTFTADAHAAIAQNAARAVEVNHRRPLLLLTVRLEFNELRLGSAVGESHILQFTFAAGVANRTVERVISKQ